MVLSRPWFIFIFQNRRRSKDMPKNIYNSKTKAAIINAAVKARRQKKTWLEAFEAAKKAGYAGSLQGITKMIRALRLKGELKGKKGVFRRRGRRGRKPGGGKVSSIETMVAGLVKARVRAVLDSALSALQKARKL
jgi:hypothetical protein